MPVPLVLLMKRAAEDVDPSPRLAAYRFMWLFAVLELPVLTKPERT